MMSASIATIDIFISIAYITACFSSAFHFGRSFETFAVIALFSSIMILA